MFANPFLSKVRRVVVYEFNYLQLTGEIRIFVSKRKDELFN